MRQNIRQNRKVMPDQLTKILILSRLILNRPRSSPPRHRFQTDEGRGETQPFLLSKNTACSPNRFQNHHGALSRSGEPQAFRATAFSIRTPISVQSWRKSLMVQWWILGVSYQLKGRMSVRGI